MPESSQSDVAAALNTLDKAKKVIESARTKGKEVSRSLELIDIARGSLAKKDYARCIRVAKEALHKIGEKSMNAPKSVKVAAKLAEDDKAAKGAEAGPVPTVAEAKEPEPEEAVVAPQMIISGNQQDALKAYYEGKNLNKYAGILGVGKKEAAPATAQPPKEEAPEPKTVTLQPVRTLAPARPKPAGPTPIDEIRKVEGLAPLLMTSETKCYLESVLTAGGPNAFALPDPSKIHKLPFSHGIEMEMQVIKENGDWIEGSILETIFREIIKAAHAQLEREISGKALPPLIAGNIKRIWTQDINDPGHIRGLVLMLEYMLDGKPITIELIGRDPHGVGVTWLMEAVTPPCWHAEELEWWVHQLIRLTYLGVLRVQEAFAKGTLPIPPGSSFRLDDANLMLVNTGLNPTQKFVTGISFGDHHHIGIPDKDLRKEVYNTYRNFLPHLISLSVNSPFESSKVPDIKFTKNRIIASPLSIRLALNEGQICSGEAATHIPHLLPEHDLTYFINAINKSDSNSARLVEMFPFTKFGTIEVRIFDDQLSPHDRVGMAMLLQALALRTKRMKERGEKVPSVSAYALVENRKRAIKKGGLLGLKKDGELDKSAPEFARIYQDNLAEDPKEEITRISQACQNMLFYVKDELRDICPQSNYLDTFLISLYGGEMNKAEPPLSEAQYQLFAFNERCKKNMSDTRAASPALTQHLGNIVRVAALSKRVNPLVAEFGNPNVPPFLLDLPLRYSFHVPPAVFPGSDCLVSLSLKNPSDQPLAGVKVSASAVNNREEQVFESQATLGDLAKDQERFLPLALRPKSDEAYLTLRVQVQTAASAKPAVMSFDVQVDRFYASVAYAGKTAGGIQPITPLPLLIRLRHTAKVPQQVKLEVGFYRLGQASPVKTHSQDVEVPTDKEVLLANALREAREEFKKYLDFLKPSEMSIPAMLKTELGASGEFYLTIKVTGPSGQQLAHARSDAFKMS